MRTQLVAASVMGVAIWCLLAVNTVPTIREERVYYTNPVPAVLVVECKDGEPCNAKKRIEKARTKWVKQ